MSTSAFGSCVVKAAASHGSEHHLAIDAVTLVRPASVPVRELRGELGFAGARGRPNRPLRICAPIHWR